nr:hypothetical protein [uncultured Fretibacterium sp.]
MRQTTILKTHFFRINMDKTPFFSILLPTSLSNLFSNQVLSNVAEQTRRRKINHPVSSRGASRYYTVAQRNYNPFQIHSEILSGRTREDRAFPAKFKRTSPLSSGLVVK